VELQKRRELATTIPDNQIGRGNVRAENTNFSSKLDYSAAHRQSNQEVEFLFDFE